MLLSKKFNFLRPIKTSKLIRLGNNQDGGYLLPIDALKKSENLISFGLGDNFSFEMDFFKKKPNSLIYVFDHTVNIFTFIWQVYIYFKRIFYFKSNFKIFFKKIVNLKNYHFFFNQINVQHFRKKIVAKKKKANQSDLKNIFEMIKSNENIISIDIEGCEYKIIDDLKKFSNKINLLIIEFHDLDNNFFLFKNKILMLKKFFNIVHLHGNNNSKCLDNGLPNVLEITFLNKSKFKLRTRVLLKNFPTKLDFPNQPLKEDYSFSFY
jgi:hypothetical protein